MQVFEYQNGKKVEIQVDLKEFLSKYNPDAIVVIAHGWGAGDDVLDLKNEKLISKFDIFSVAICKDREEADSHIEGQGCGDFFYPTVSKFLTMCQ